MTTVAVAAPKTRTTCRRRLGWRRVRFLALPMPPAASSLRALFLAVAASSLLVFRCPVVVPPHSSFASAAWTASPRASPSRGRVGIDATTGYSNDIRVEGGGAGGGGGGGGGGIVVMGKIIIDEYLRAPADADDDAVPPSVSVGGGGPQAAWGAAAALAALELLASRGRDEDPHSERVPPGHQQVILVAPVGDADWRDDVEGKALRESLGGAVRGVRLIPGPKQGATPRIQLWHDENQAVKWKALNDSFGPRGADSLWRDCPDARDVLSALDDITNPVDVGGGGAPMGTALHAILEMGESAPGGGLDGAPLWDPVVLQRIDYLGVEPVAFPEEPNEEGWSTGDPRVSAVDAASCAERLGRLVPNLDFVCPDECLYGSLDGGGGFWRGELKCDDVAVRDGPRGSFLVLNDGNGDGETETTVVPVPAARLRTADGTPVNPTGAGNAYAGAFAACRGSAGRSALEAACVASAVGAVVCEHEDLPPWDWDTMRRIAEAVDDVREGMGLGATVMGMGRDVIGAT